MHLRAAADILCVLAVGTVGMFDSDAGSTGGQSWYIKQGKLKIVGSFFDLADICCTLRSDCER